MISNLQNFLSFAISESKNIFQKYFPKKFSNKIFQENFSTLAQKNFPERAVENYLAFVDATNKLISGGVNEETKETKDDRRRHSHYPSA